MKLKLSEKQLSPSEFNDFENGLKNKLPETYKKIISEYNGGYPERRYFKGGGVYFTPIKYGDFTIEDMLDSERLPNKDYFPFADYSGMTLAIFLDKQNYGKIYCIDEGGQVELVCNSFDDFMTELSDDPDY